MTSTGDIPVALRQSVLGQEGELESPLFCRPGPTGFCRSRQRKRRRETPEVDGAPDGLLPASMIGGPGALAQDTSGKDVMEGRMKDTTGHPH